MLKVQVSWLPVFRKIKTIALFNSIGYAISGAGLPGRPEYALGYIWLPALLTLVSCSVLTAPLGARLAHALDVQPLKRIFALLLYALAAYMFWKGVQH